MILEGSGEPDRDFGQRRNPGERKYWRMHKVERDGSKRKAGKRIEVGGQSKPAGQKGQQRSYQGLGPGHGKRRRPQRLGEVGEVEMGVQLVRRGTSPSPMPNEPRLPCPLHVAVGGQWPSFAVTPALSMRLAAALPGLTQGLLRARARTWRASRALWHPVPESHQAQRHIASCPRCRL